MKKNKVHSYEIERALNLHELISKTLKEYEDEIESMEHKGLENGPAIILKINSNDIQIYPSSSGTNVYLSINGIARIVDSFDKIKNTIEDEVSFPHRNFS